MKNIPSSNPDDWDSHWKHFFKLTEENPADLYRYNLLIDLLDINNDGSECNLIDLGCGDGAFISHFLKKYPRANIIGIDASRTAIKRAKLANPNAKFICMDLSAFNFIYPKKYFGWATHTKCSEVIEQLDNPNIFLKNAKYFLKKNSFLVLSVPGGPLSEFHLYIGHRQHFSKESISKLILKSGYHISSIYRAGFPFFNLYRICTQLRGKKLLDDLGINRTATSYVKHRSHLLYIAFSVFSKLFKFNLSNFPFGWQLIAKIRTNIS